VRRVHADFCDGAAAHRRGGTAADRRRSSGRASTSSVAQQQPTSGLFISFAVQKIGRGARADQHAFRSRDLSYVLAQSDSCFLIHARSFRAPSTMPPCVRRGRLIPAPACRSARSRALSSAAARDACSASRREAGTVDWAALAEPARHISPIIWPPARAVSTPPRAAFYHVHVGHERGCLQGRVRTHELIAKCRGTRLSKPSTHETTPFH